MLPNPTLPGRWGTGMTEFALSLERQINKRLYIKIIKLKE
ncbi:hypothetical protein O23A_p3172 [Aeromonas salmonicida]|nr:hypothetical protein O23A_p3172 [Aeromonas salmonicida]